jgi:hypothetical protein
MGSTGQWRAPNGAIEHEASCVPSLAHAPGEADELAVQTIMRKYREEFRQNAVLRVRSRGCLSLGHT